MNRFVSLKLVDGLSQTGSMVGAVACVPSVLPSQMHAKVLPGMMCNWINTHFNAIGNLALSRALGDFGYKNRDKAPELQVISGKL